MSGGALVVSYIAFALIAAAINIGSQWLCLREYGGPLALTLAMGVGTGSGLVTKYLLDKRWIFRDSGGGVANHSRKFLLYALMGAGTTALFWLTEAVFDALSQDGQLRFVGAGIGLAIGYVAKYHLDRRFVFRGAT